MVDWDFNTDLEASEGGYHREDISADVVTAKLEDISAHFILRRKYWAWDRRPWIVCCQGKEVRSWTD